MLTLQNNHQQLKLAPEFGGSVISFQVNGQHVLRPAKSMTANTWDARNTAGFPMLPFVGRLSQGRFVLGERTIQLPANMPPEPHAIHGFGWQVAWTVSDASPTHAVLEHTYRETIWPWHYEATQVFMLNEEGLTLTLSLENQSDTAMPAGFGWHPYFPADAAHLIAPVTASWTGNAGPPEHIPLTSKTDLRHLRAVESLNLDTAFNCDPIPIEIKTRHHQLMLDSDPIFSKLTVYTPQGENYFCVEPITHAPDALNMTLPVEDTGLVWLAPDETLTGRIHLSVSPL
ncbi:MAG: aldose 1-epimerase [Pseudomonadota bacterium]